MKSAFWLNLTWAQNSKGPIHDLTCSRLKSQNSTSQTCSDVMCLSLVQIWWLMQHLEPHFARRWTVLTYYWLPAFILVPVWLMYICLLQEHSSESHGPVSKTLIDHIPFSRTQFDPKEIITQTTKREKQLYIESSARKVSCTDRNRLLVAVVKAVRIHDLTKESHDSTKESNLHVLRYEWA